MDEKSRLHDMSPVQRPLPPQSCSSSNRRHHHRRRFDPTIILSLALIAMSLYAYGHIPTLTQLATTSTASYGHHHHQYLQWHHHQQEQVEQEEQERVRQQQQQQPPLNTDSHSLVPLEAHIMSKCPDAKDCLKYMVLPAMQRVVDKVNFTLSFIGTPTEDDGVACKHGPEECLGNIIELCAQSLYPDPKTYLGFTMCLTRDYPLIPQRSLVEDCALEHAIDFNKLNECATKDDGAFGVDMLRSSVRRSSEAGVTKSCTVRLDNQIYCVRDDGEWKECPSGSEVNDLVIAVEKLYHRPSSPSSSSSP